MKILHVTKKYPNALGGDSVVVSNLHKHQETAAHQVAILTSNCPEIQTGQHIYKCGLDDTAAGLDNITLKRLISLIGLFFKAFRVCAKERPDIIHTHSIDMAFFVSFAARFYRIPLIHTFHIVTFYDKDQPALRRKSELLLARAAHPAIITAPNTHDVRALKKAGLKQTVLLPNGVDLDFWQAAPRRTANHEFTFLSVGRLESQKGYEYVIKAAAKLKQATRQLFHITIVGEGGQKKSLQRLARTHGVQDIVEFTGRKQPEEVRSLLGTADAAICASLYETTPITLLEAWAVGTPVIMTPVGIMRGVPANSGHVYLVKPRNVSSLSSVMEQVMTDQTSREQVAEAGHQEAKKYAWAHIAKMAEGFYGSVL